MTGASGYIGGRLIPLLLDEGLNVRILAAIPSGSGSEHGSIWSTFDWGRHDAADLDTAMTGVDVAYYLMHSLASGQDFEAAQRRTARTFARAAATNDVRRIVYLGGMVPDGRAKLSPHLRSRAQVGEILRAGQTPTIELRAAVIIGSGSASFEMLRAIPCVRLQTDDPQHRCDRRDSSIRSTDSTTGGHDRRMTKAIAGVRRECT